MTSLLELPAAHERMHRLSVEDYHRAFEAGAISENVELLRGIIVNKTPKSPQHEFVAQKLILLLLALLPKAFQVRCERPLTLRDSEPEPDLSVVRGQPEDWLIHAAERTTDIHREPTPEGYRRKITLAASDSLQSTGLPGVNFPLADIFPIQK